MTEEELPTAEEIAFFARQRRALFRRWLAVILLPVLAAAALLVRGQIASSAGRLALAVAAGALLAATVVLAVCQWRTARRARREWGE